MLKISEEKLAYVILSAKEHEEHAGRWDEIVQNSFNETSVSPISDELQGTTARSSLSAVVDELNEAEKTSLIALSLIGRGEVEADDLDKAMSIAQAEDTDRATNNLLGSPMVASYLEEGLEKLTHSANDSHAGELQKF